jgi:non-ribosomal peptide synthetase-like protein
MTQRENSGILEKWTAAGTIAVLRGPSRPDLLIDECLADILTATASHRPQHPALIWGERIVTYGELVTAGNTIGSALVQRGAAAGRTVGLWLPRGADLLIAQAGITISGSAWLPFDADTPVERIQTCLESAGACGIVTCRQWLPRVNHLPVPVWSVEDLLIETTLSTPDKAKNSDPAYVIYTSGSTGEPKGIIVTHRSICHFLRSENEILGINEHDRVYQGFSVSFDMSFEEIWISYLVGATLWIAPSDLVGDPQRLAQEVKQNRITVMHAVPTLLGMIDAPLPTVRLINLGGEACPETLVSRIAIASRRVFNTYGPTETAVSASITELMPDQPVTIGTPLPNYGMMVVDDHHRPVSVDEVGELSIFGPGLALGYLNRPDITAGRFIPNPAAENPDEERLYLTGDLARIDGSTGQVHFLGRADGQVKIRGYRIELEEIEAALVEQPGVLAAAAAVHAESQRIAAYVVPRAGATLDRAAIRTALAQRLPPYMVPAFLDELIVLPTSASGKVDRRSLPQPHVPLTSSRGDDPVGGRNEAERIVLEVWSSVLGSNTLSPTADFFSDLGGHSLLAALAVSRLRREPGFSGLSLSDLYAHPTAEELARLRTEPAAEKAAAPFRETSRASYWACAAGQAAAVPFFAALHTWQWLGAFLAYGYLVVADHPIREALLAAFIIEITSTPVLLGLSVALKWLLLGRIRPGVHPLWGWYYFRFWLVRGVILATPVDLLSGTPWLCIYYRLMGARIGRDVYFGARGSRRSAGLCTSDVLTVGDGTSIGMDTSIDGSWVEGGNLHLGPISIGRDCFIGNRCAIGANTAMGDGAGLGDLSMLPDGSRVPAGELWTGSPAAPSGRLAPKVDARSPWNAACVAIQGLGTLLFPFVPLAAVFPGLMLVTYLGHGDEGYSFLAISPLIGLSFVVMHCLLIWAVKWLLIGRLREGRYPIGGSLYLRKWFFDHLMDMSLEVTASLYTTLYLRPWLRILGARIGRRPEIDEVRFQPDLFVAGDECFLGGDILIGAPRVRGGWVEYRKVRAGRRLFGGTGAVLPGGVNLGSSVLMGTYSIPPRAPDGVVPDDSAWFGSPPINLRTRTEERFPEDRLYRPPARLIALRLFIEFFRVILPMSIFVALVSLMLNTTDILQDYISLTTWLASVPLLYLAAGALAVLVTVLLKYLLIGRYKAGAHPIWSAYVWRSELIAAIYSNLCATFFLELVRGTPFIAWPLRALGMKVGRRCYIDSTFFSDYDLVEIGDDAALNENAAPVTQLFEGRVMCMGPVRIGHRCSLGAEALLQYNTEMLEGSTIGELSLLMKGETLPAGTRWHGIPAKRV